MADHKITEAGLRELETHLSDERREILSRAYEKHYADKNPGPFDAETIADAIAEIHSESRVSSNVIEPLIVSRQVKLRRLRLILDLYQLAGVLVGVTGIGYLLYGLLGQWLRKSVDGSYSSYFASTYYPPAFLASYLGFVIAYATWFLGRRLLAYREFLFGAEQLAATDAVARRSSVPRSAEVATRFLYEWTTLERILRTVYEDQFNQATPNLRDALRRLEDEALLSNYETAKVVENLRLRNLLVHGDFPENIPVSELAKATDEIRQIRRKLEIRERERPEREV
ncbi:hypothetical protein [Mycolicibacterium pallens]|uniref:DUF4145 domain-containing protein n=1 Tax=Mycolicibacterium pallens TaxID=370524 RepID=A0ABX8VRB1_9MYCO|nr:hypothetical protein [Mycolicibacterium pallens]QYL17989.1 hypothetical protein K0O64_05405 [Mycolicibacterium pallens]